MKYSALISIYLHFGRSVNTVQKERNRKSTEERISHINPAKTFVETKRGAWITQATRKHRLLASSWPRDLAGALFIHITDSGLLSRQTASGRTFPRIVGSILAQSLHQSLAPQASAVTWMRGGVRPSLTPALEIVNLPLPRPKKKNITPEKG